MMKRIVLILVAALMTGGVVMAQRVRRGDQMPEPKVRAERMTERMVKEYSLNDTQKKQLFEANLALAEKIKDMPKHHRQDMRKGKKEGKRMKMTDEQRAQRKEEMQKKWKEMEEARTAYDAKIQKIMTKEQYAAYDKKKQERKERMELNRKKRMAD